MKQSDDKCHMKFMGRNNHEYMWQCSRLHTHVYLQGRWSARQGTYVTTVPGFWRGRFLVNPSNQVVTMADLYLQQLQRLDLEISRSLMGSFWARRP